MDPEIKVGQIWALKALHSYKIEILSCKWVESLKQNRMRYKDRNGNFAGSLEDAFRDYYKFVSEPEIHCLDKVIDLLESMAEDKEVVGNVYRDGDKLVCDVTIPKEMVEKYLNYPHISRINYNLNK